MADNLTCAIAFANFTKNLDLVIEQLTKGESERAEAEDFQLDTFWSKLGILYQAISQEATKISLAFSKPPHPSDKDSESMIASAEKTALALISTFYSLPKSKGRQLKKSTRMSVLGIIEALKYLSQSIHTGFVGSSSQLQSTGTVWERVDAFPKLPKNNKDASLLSMKEVFGLVQDAVSEFEVVVNNEGHCDELDELMMDENDEPVNEAAWTESDKCLLDPTRGLLKTAKSVVKKCRQAVQTNGSCDAIENTIELDNLTDHTQRMSPLVDELATSFYPPVQQLTVKKHGENLADCLQQTLLYIRTTHLITESDQQWVEFLLMATQHNLQKILLHIENGT